MQYLLVLVVTGLLALGGVWGFQKSQRSGGNPATPSIYTAPGAAAKPSKSGNAIILSVVSPANGSTVTTPQITVTGQTVPNAEVTVNDQDVTADASGNFSVNVTLDEGENTINVQTNDSDGNTSEQELTVTLQSGT